MTEEWLLLALITLGLLDLAAIVIGWLADRHLTRTAHHPARRADGPRIA